MSNKKGNKPRQPSAIERLNNLEIRQGVFVQKVQEAFGQNNTRMVAVERAVNAIIEIVGVEEVQTKIQEEIYRQQEERVTNQEQAVAEALEQGRLEAVDIAVDDETLLVLQEKDKEDNILHPTKIFQPLGGFANQPKVKELLEGRRVGDEVKTPEGHTLVILEAYRSVHTPPEAPAAEPATAEEAPAEQGV